MKTITVVVALLVALVCHTSLTAVQGKESVAELRRLRALGSGYNSNGHHFGGDNGRDHPAQYQQQQAAAAAAQEEQTVRFRNVSNRVGCLNNALLTMRYPFLLHILSFFLQIFHAGSYRKILVSLLPRVPTR